jgi:hypothetical protein
MVADDERARLEARQWRLQRGRDSRHLEWLEQLERTPDPALVERALRKLGFRELVRDGDVWLVVDGGDLIPVLLDPGELARLVRARTDAGWSFADVRPLIRPGSSLVPGRYRPLGHVVALDGELPAVRLDADVRPGSTVAFEVGRSYREWIVERELGYVGTPAPAVGSPVWLVED